MWGAHKADGRIAAKNAVKIRAALRQSINARQVFERYQETHPFVSDNITQDRARARAWAMLNVGINSEPLLAALKKVYADGYVMGEVAADEAITKATRRRTQNKTLDVLGKADQDLVDWAAWTPGDEAAALLLSPEGAFEKLLAEAGIVSRSIEKAGYDKIGTALADSIAAGFSPAKAAKVITEKIGDPARALTIAITEQNRAMSVATVNRYREAGVEKMEWSAANPCDICAPNEGQIVELGQEFESGDTEPPVHPNCRCALLPVIEGMEDDASLGQDFLDTLDGASVEEYPESLTVEQINDILANVSPSQEGDSYLGAIQEAMGFNKLPNLVTKEELESLIDAGWTRTYRGIADVNNGAIPAADLVQQYKTGQHFPGLGIYGNGTYTSNDPRTAAQYANGNYHNVMSMAISPDAKIVRAKTIAIEMGAKNDALFQRALETNTVGGLSKTGEWKVLQDVGRYAASQGYDVLEVPLLDIKGNLMETYYVILNRGKVAVVDEQP